MPEGCRAKFHTCAKYDPEMLRRPAHLRIPKWNPTPKPANVLCERPHCKRSPPFSSLTTPSTLVAIDAADVPMACHKCWHWNHRTWNKMTKYCPEVQIMRDLRALYKVTSLNG